jgi:hypothetical protein
MPTLAEIMADDIDRIAVDAPATLVWEGQSVSCTSSPVMRSDDVAGEGVLSVSTVEVLARVDGFTGSVPPPPRAKVSLTSEMHGHGDAVNYFVVDRETDIAGVRITLRRA